MYSTHSRQHAEAFEHVLHAEHRGLMRYHAPDAGKFHSGIAQQFVDEAVEVFRRHAVEPLAVHAEAADVAIIAVVPRGRRA